MGLCHGLVSGGGVQLLKNEKKVQHGEGVCHGVAGGGGVQREQGCAVHGGGVCGHSRRRYLIFLSVGNESVMII